MQISSRVTIAVHVLAAIDIFQDEHKITSDFLASSIQVNPVIIRRVMQQLKAAQLIEVKRGTGGMHIAKDTKDITFYDIFEAVDSLENGQLFHFHENPSKDCPVGRNIHHGLDDKLVRIQQAMENEMKQITLKDIIDDTQIYIKKEAA